VATDVGGVRAAAGECALMIEPGDAGAAVEALERIRLEPELRTALTEAGAQNVGERTLEAEARRAARFLARRSE
jgi:glycosyltransferase involved in cell wall biosynthesis